MKTKSRLKCWKMKSGDRKRKIERRNREMKYENEIGSKGEQSSLLQASLRRSFHDIVRKNGGEGCVVVVEDGREWRTIFSIEKTRPRDKDTSRNSVSKTLKITKEKEKKIIN